MPERQSPVDIPPSAPVHTEGLVLAYRPVPLVIAPHDYVLQVDCPGGGHALIEGRRYELVQFHLHWPGEHGLDGQRGVAELHLVHAAPAEEPAVVAVPLTAGASHRGLEPLVAVLAGRGPPSIDPTTLVPSDRSHVRYDGSLTIPPFTEGISWYVLTSPATISAAQLNALEGVRVGYCRPVQPLNGRAFR